ncbi:MAG: hypothetical protein V1914_04750 [archaeon]
MEISEKNTYAFDECSVLHLCKIEIPGSFRVFCDNKEEIAAKNFEKLSSFIALLNTNKIAPYRFIPDDMLNNNLLNSMNGLIETNGINVTMLPDVFKMQLIDQVQEFFNSLSNFEFIHKKEDYTAIKEFFKINERRLSKSERGYSNIPEPDDCKILAGFIEHQSEGDKFLITEDEHFWGYTDLIKEAYNVQVIPEWECL